MAGLRSNYELKKWQAVQSQAQVPLAKVISGLYTEKDMNTLGQALEAYDELAASIFNEGLKAVETSAKERVEKVQEHRTLVKKPPLSARQLAVIYGQAIDKAQKETMPELIDAIKEILQLRAIENQPDREPLRVVGSEPQGSPQPKPTPYNLERFTPGSPAANDVQDRPQEEPKAEEPGRMEQALELVDDLSSDLEDLDDGLEDLGKDMKEVLDLVRAGYEADAKEKSKLEDLLDRIETGSVGYDSSSQQLKLSYISDSGYYHEVTGKSADDLKKSLSSINAQDRKRKALDKDAREKEVARREQAQSKGLLNKPLRGMERAARLKELKKARRENAIKTGTLKEGAFSKARRLVDNSQEEYSKITEMLKERYSKSLVGKTTSKLGGIGKMLLGLFLLPKMLSGLWDGFTKNFDVDKFLDEALDSTLTSVWNKVKSLIGIDTGEGLDPNMGYRGNTIAQIDKMKDDDKTKQVSMDRQKAAIVQDLAGPKAYEYTEAEAKLIKDRFGIDIPEDRLKKDANSTAAPSPGSGGSSSGMSTPSSGGSTPGAQAGSPAAPSRTSSGKITTAPSSTPAPAPTAPASTSAQVSPSGGAGGLSASTPIALSTATTGKPGGAASPSNMVTATPPPSPQAQASPSSSGTNKGPQAGSSPVNASSIPNMSANNESSLYMNRSTANG